MSDGSPGGLRHVEIANWSGQALACPRSRFTDLKNWQESQRPGVYFLLEKNSSGDKSTVYIGESENVFKRLADHDRKKDFWNEVVIFTSKDENLTKSHIKYLESKLTALAVNADRTIIENGNTPPESALPKADVAAMEEFIHNLKMIMGTLGHKLLDPLNAPDRQSEESLTTLNGRTLLFTVNGLNSTGTQTDEGFVLGQGSEISKSTTTSIPGKVNNIRSKLIEEGRLVDQDDKYVLNDDIVLSSSSYAAALVAGTSRSGPQSWKDSNGRTMKQLEELLIKN